MSEGEGGAAGAGPGAGQSDSTLLSPLTEDTFLHNLQLRYQRDLIYTYCGDAVTAVNPWRALPLYSAELARTYLSRAPHTLQPHIYAVAASAYRCVRDRGLSQCILVTGESGAGKTEAARVCLQCVVVGAGQGGAGQGGSGQGGAGRALTAAGTLLEAFGNAVTQRNHNASRFGKILDVELDFKGEIVGGHVTHCEYLSYHESRAGRLLEGERNFHVFYQLLAGADAHTLKRLRLQRSWRTYRVLSSVGSGGGGGGGGGSDAEHYAHTQAALSALGVAAETRGSLLRVLAFLLKLANVEFQPARHIDGSIGARTPDEHEVSEACALVGVSAAALLRALGVTHTRALAHEREEWEEDSASSGELSCCGEEAEAEEEETETASGGAEWASAARDSLLAAVYDRLFTWLVTAVNDAVRPAALGARRTLAIVDLYGFESLAHNALERLVINYAAEAVQAAAVRAVSLVPRPDVADVVDVTGAGEAVTAAVTAAVTVAARGGGGGDGRADEARLLAELARLRSARVLPLPPHRFQVVHWAGAVTYCARGLCAADREPPPPRPAAVLRAATDPLLAALFPEPRGAGSPRRAGSACARQRALVAALVRRLAAAGAQLRLVHCLRPHTHQRPARLDPHLLRHQIRTQGLVEMTCLRRAGWSECMSTRELVRRYGAGAGSAVRALPAGTAAVCGQRVLLRAPALWLLEERRRARLQRLVSAAQRAWRQYRARRRVRAAVTVQRAWRRRKVERERRGACAGGEAAWRAAGCIQRLCVLWIRRRYLTSLWSRLPVSRASPLCAAWPPPPAPRLLGHTDHLLRHIHHRWRCYKYRLSFDQTARNRMREKVTASILFKDRKQSYPRSVSHPFVGDYVRLRASAAWRRRCGTDAYVVFADVVGKVCRATGRRSPALLVVSTAALLLLEPRSLRLKRRVAASHVRALSLSPAHDDLLVVHVLPASSSPTHSPTAHDPSSPTHTPAHSPTLDAHRCMFTAESRGRGDVVVQTCHVLELATKLFLVVQNAASRAPAVTVAPSFQADFGRRPVTVAFHRAPSHPAQPAHPPTHPPTLLRRGSRLDVLL